jgi:23S rRNA (guanosine2251-2'-O)-methyltransferase
MISGMKPEIIVVLHNVRSAHNVGSIFRTSDAIGVSKIILSGYSPRPIDRFGRPVKEIAKTALGAESYIPWEGISEFGARLKQYRKDGYVIVGFEQDLRAIDYCEWTPPERVVVIVGSEVRGMSPALRAKCDVLLEIPMNGKKESLNVSVAYGVGMFRVFG